MKHFCTRCGKLMHADGSRRGKRRDRGKRHEGTVESEARSGMAARVRCGCGLLHILVRGSL